MNISYDKIFLVDYNNNKVSLSENRAEEELAKRYAENSLDTLTDKFGRVEEIELRYDLVKNLTAPIIKSIGGNNQQPVFEHIINAENENYKIMQLIIVQKQAPVNPKIKLIERIKKIFIHFLK